MQDFGTSEGKKIGMLKEMILNLSLHLPELMGIISADRMNFQTVDEFYEASPCG